MGKIRGVMEQLRITKELYGNEAARRELKQHVKLGYLKTNTAASYARQLGIPFKKRRRRTAVSKKRWWKH